MKKFIQKTVSVALGSSLVLGLVACESSEPKRKKAVPPSSDMSGLPWNRPTAAEGSARFGSMVPQSR